LKERKKVHFGSGLKKKKSSLSLLCRSVKRGEGGKEDPNEKKKNGMKGALFWKRRRGISRRNEKISRGKKGSSLMSERKETGEQVLPKRRKGDVFDHINSFSVISDLLIGWKGRGKGSDLMIRERKKRGKRGGPHFCIRWPKDCANVWKEKKKKEKGGRTAYSSWELNKEKGGEKRGPATCPPTNLRILFAWRGRREERGGGKGKRSLSMI